MSSFLLSLLTILSITNLHSSNALTENYYGQTCPKAEAKIQEVVKKGVLNDKTVPAALLRMHFHDCFIRGCDASVLLKSKGNDQAERDGPPNVSLHAFYVIDNAKKELEKMCPGVVSCADILAIAARDVVQIAGGPSWGVLKGRKDGRVSLGSETSELPAPTFNISELQQSFSQRGLSMDDLVALSGGHTLGFAHCSSFEDRLYDFDDEDDVDPSLDTSFAARLKKTCPKNNKVNSAGANLDSSPTVFDNAYFKMLLKGKSIFTSDQALVTDPKTKELVKKFAYSQEDFFEAFVKSMIKMGSINGAGTEIRLDCGVVNY